MGTHGFGRRDQGRDLKRIARAGTAFPFYHDGLSTLTDDKAGVGMCAPCVHKVSQMQERV